MSKLAGGATGTSRQDLEALVGAGDTSVPGIEMSDLNDGDILAATRENVNPSGLFQFVYTAIEPPIVSDWVDQEHKKKLVRQWVDGVKSNLIARANEKINEAKEKQLEDRAKRIREEQFAEPPMAAAVFPVVRKETSTRVVGAASDPATYIEEQLEMTRERLRAAEEAQQDITREVIGARRDYEKWKALSAAISGTEPGGDVSVPVAQLEAKQQRIALPGASGNRRSV